MKVSVTRSLWWGGLAVLALWWPGRFIGPLDGIPLDGKGEAVLLGLVFPLLWWFHPGALRTVWARGLIASLLVVKLGTWLVLTQGGWCGTFLTQNPLVVGGSLTQQSWDLRSDWHRPNPRCSAIIARPYDSLDAFPVWFINLLDSTVGDRWLYPRSSESERPPHGVFTMEVEGYLTTPSPGTLTFSTDDDVRLIGTVDTIPVTSERQEPLEVRLERGIHRIHLSATLSGSAWAFIPLWNGKDLWGSVLTTVEAPTALERAFWALGRVVTPLLAAVLMLWWAVSSLRTIRPTVGELAWVGVASLVMGTAGFLCQDRTLRLAVLLLFSVVFLPVSRRLQNLRGVFLLLGVPWLSLFVVKHLWQIGRFTLYSIGDDWLTFQVFAHRIFMQGYWLEGGERTFYFQPFYRWINGALHLIFGDSSVGEVYWDSIALLIGALFCFHVVKRFVGFRWGVCAAVATLATFAIGPMWYLIGRGLSEISAAGWAYLAGFCILRGRLGRISSAVMGGAFGILTFYTRLNHFPFAMTMTALAAPLTTLSGRCASVTSLRGRTLAKFLGVYLGCLALGLLLFAGRTWYYTGVFSVLHGTQWTLLSTGLSPSTVLSPDAWRRALESVLVVMTVHDPPEFHKRGLLVLFGTVAALLALIRAPIAKRLPLGLSVVCVGGLAASLLVRGGGYSGRFSVHLVPVATAIAFCAIALIVHRLMRRVPL